MAINILKEPAADVASALAGMSAEIIEQIIAQHRAEIERLETAVFQEREACAKVCEDTFITAQDTEFDSGVEHARREFVRRIRNR